MEKRANNGDSRNRKDQLKKNPVISNDELNEISGGLGDEAAREFGGKLSRAFD